MIFTSSFVNIHDDETFSASLTICAENSPVPGEFSAQRPVTRSFDVLFDLCLSKRMSKQSWGWWFETLPRPLWRQCNDCQIASPVTKIVNNKLITTVNIDFPPPRFHGVAWKNVEYHAKMINHLGIQNSFIQVRYNDEDADRSVITPFKSVVT